MLAARRRMERHLPALAPAGRATHRGTDPVHGPTRARRSVRCPRLRLDRPRRPAVRQHAPRAYRRGLVADGVGRHLAHGAVDPVLRGRGATPRCSARTARPMSPGAGERASTSRHRRAGDHRLEHHAGGRGGQGHRGRVPPETRDRPVTCCHLRRADGTVIVRPGGGERGAMLVPLRGSPTSDPCRAARSV